MKCLAQEHNIKKSVGAETRTAQSRIQKTNYEADMSPKRVHTYNHANIIIINYPSE